MTFDVRVRRLTGPATRPRHRLLLLHGLGNSDAIWRATREHWAPGFDVWAAQLPWRGDGPADWSHGAGLTRAVERALELVPGGADVLVAHSFAANVSLELFSQDPQAAERHGLRAVALLAPFYRRRPEDFRWHAIAEQLELFKRTIELGIDRHGGRPLAQDLRADVVRHICERIGPYGWTRFFDTYLRTPWLRTERVALPCLVVAGEADETAPPEEAAHLAADLPHAVEHRLDECGHFPMVEQPALLAAIVRDFLCARVSRAELVEGWYR